MDSDPKAIPGTSKGDMTGDLSSAIGTGPHHEASGIKNSFHGAIYQVKLAMFFIVRAFMNSFEFDIGTEVDEAEKFDDLVCKFENNTEKRVVFLQAKHRLDDGKTINEIDLFNKNGHFCMPKYYYSYSSILMNKYLKKFLKDAKVTLVIYTNIGIDKSIQNNFEEVAIGEFANNGFLHPGPAAALAKFYKITPDTTFYTNLVSYLEKIELPSKLAQALAKSVVDNKQKSIKIDDQFQKYRECLLENIFNHIIDTTGKNNKYLISFKECFLSKEDLPVDVLQFREEFIKTFMKARKEPKGQSITDEEIQKELLGVKYQVTRDFIKGKGTKQDGIKDIKDFLDALIFAVNQPNEDKLGIIVENEVGQYAGLTDRKSVACKFQKYIVDWVKQKEGRFLKKTDVEEQFSVWGHTDQSHRHINEVESVGYIFKEDDVIVNISNFLKDDNRHIVCLYYKEQLLSEIKLCQALHYEGDINNELIFSDICTLSEQMNTKMCPMKAFNSLHCNNVFIIIRKNSEIKQKEEMLLRRLLDIVKTNIQKKKAGKARKRIIMLIPLNHATINERNDFFRNWDSESVERIILEDGEVNFGQMAPDSRKKLFEKVLYIMVGIKTGRTVIDTFDDFTFQSIFKAVSNLKFQNKSIDDCFENGREMLSSFIKDEVLSQLICGDSEVYANVRENFENFTTMCSEKVYNDTLSTIITESTRTDVTFEEKRSSFLFNGLSMAVPLIQLLNDKFELFKNDP